MSKIRQYFENVTLGDAIAPLMILFFVYFFDEFDTAAFGTLVPEIKRAFGLSTGEFGFIVIMNISVVLLLAVPVGHYGDKLPRRKLVVAGALIARGFSLPPRPIATGGLL